MGGACRVAQGGLEGRLPSNEGDTHPSCLAHLQRLRHVLTDNDRAHAIQVGQRRFQARVVVGVPVALVAAVLARQHAHLAVER